MCPSASRDCCARRRRGGSAPPPASQTARSPRLRPAARASKVTHESDTQIIRGGPPGTRTVQHSEGTQWDDEEPNPGDEIGIRIDTTSTRIGGLSSSKSTVLKLTRLISRCPDAGGIGRGVLKYTQSEKQIADKPGGGRGVHEVRAELDAKVRVHFSDEARVTSVDIDGDWKWSSETRLSPERGAAEESVGLFAAGGGVTATGGADGHISSYNVGVANASSPGATVVGVLLGTIAILVPIDSISDHVSASGRRAGNGTCAKILPDPVSVHVKPNESVEISAGLRDAKDEPLTGTVKAQAAKATVTPEAQADPIARFTYSALSAVPPGRSDTVTLKHVSKRGRAREQTVTIIYDDPPPPPLPTLMAGRSPGPGTPRRPASTGLTRPT